MGTERNKHRIRIPYAAYLHDKGELNLLDDTHYASAMLVNLNRYLDSEFAAIANPITLPAITSRRGLWIVDCLNEWVENDQIVMPKGKIVWREVGGGTATYSYFTPMFKTSDGRHIYICGLEN